jgi:hypothetical protein
MHVPMRGGADAEGAMLLVMTTEPLPLIVLGNAPPLIPKVVPGLLYGDLSRLL